MKEGKRQGRGPPGQEHTLCGDWTGSGRAAGSAAGAAGGTGAAALGVSVHVGGCVGLSSGGPQLALYRTNGTYYWRRRVPSGQVRSLRRGGKVSSKYRPN